MLRIVRAKYEYAQGTHRRVLLVIRPDLLEAWIRQVEGDVVKLTTVHAKSGGAAIREDDRRRPAFEVLYHHAPLVLSCADHPFRTAGSVTSSRRA